jgi:hypothetical protein
VVAAAKLPKKPVELPPELNWHDCAVFLLHVVAEIEHALRVQYRHGILIPAA